MARTKDGSTFVAELSSANLYKRAQGRLTRQLTGLAIALVLLLGCWTLNAWLETNVSNLNRGWRLGICMLLAVGGLWATFRLVNFPRFANFLISVEAEMDKVSWADWTYLQRATVVVVTTMVAMSAYLWLCDVFWAWFFNIIGFLDLQALKTE